MKDHCDEGTEVLRRSASVPNAKGGSAGSSATTPLATAETSPREVRARSWIAAPFPVSEDSVQRIRVQNRLTRRDMPSRVAAVTMAHLLAAYFLQPLPILLILGFFYLAEIACLAARRPSEQGSGMAAALLLLSGLLCATSLTTLSLALIQNSSPVAATLSVAILVTSLSHCVIIRTAWLPLGLATALPFAVGLVLVAIELVPVSQIAPTELAVGATALAIGALYTGKGIWEMNATRQRLMRANEAVEAASRARARFFAAVSHELRTPLNAICGMAELIAEDDTSELSRERANLLLRSARSLNAIVGDILDEARLASGKHELHPRPCGLRSGIEDAVGIFMPEAAAKGLELRLTISRSVPRRAVFDPQKTRQVIANLVSNGIKYTDAGEIEVRADARRSERGWRLSIEVADTGPGIEASRRDALFQDYERLAADGEDIPGTGLGLVISRRFARMMGGDIEVDSQPGRGSTFRFTSSIGAATGHTSRRKDTDQVPHGGVPPQAGGPGRRVAGPAVLIVDDTATNRYVAKAYLRDFARRIDEAENGRKALDLIARNRYDVVLLDMQMPVLDGSGMLRELRSGPHARLPVIVLSASDAPAPGRDGTPEIGEVSATLGKPVLKHELIAAIRAATRSSPNDGAILTPDFAGHTNPAVAE